MGIDVQSHRLPVCKGIAGSKTGQSDNPERAALPDEALLIERLDVVEFREVFYRQESGGISRGSGLYGVSGRTQAFRNSPKVGAEAWAAIEPENGRDRPGHFRGD